MRPSKRNELVDEALKIFYRNGFHATGMDMLAKQTGISKTSMYKYFPTKEDLILATLKRRDEKFFNWFMGRVEGASPVPQDQLIAIFDAIAEWFGQPDFRSCMFIKASAEYQDPAHPIHIQSSEHKNLMLDYIEKIAQAAKLNKPKTIARQLMLLIEGAIVTAHFGHTTNPAQDARKAAKILINHALPPISD